MPKPIIFLTGATGKIGSVLLKDLVGGDYQIIVLSRKKRTEHMDNPKVKYIYGDISDPTSYGFGLKGADIVLHMAAMTHTNKVSDYYELNSTATAKLVKKCEELDVKRFIFISTRAISQRGGHYSVSKLMAEECVRRSGLNWVIMRLSEVYGMEGESGVGMVLSRIEKLPFVPIIGNGEYKVAPVHISDVLFAIKQVIGRYDIKSRIYSIAGPESFTLNEFIDTVLKAKNIKKIRVHIPVSLIRACAHILFLLKMDKFFVADQLPRLFCEKSADISLAVDELGFRPIALEESLKS